ncbi:hypothetical protein EUGRSUZ_B02315 [Eucalyptus grandis]|uniref:Uncharacterized protein n=2 Tax=Eucalyptus grandis TaxID=71139 RepID=A0ACC3LT10_EUCGR|nr:hypothetical protein EUGRSUZ_B02315 [Eucalyptus grandis]
MASLPTSAALKSTLLFSAAHLFLHFTLSAGHGGSDGSPDTGSTPDLHARGLILVKVWCLIIMLVTTFAGGVSPYFFRWNEAFLLLGTQFAGGVFLGTSLMHFLSDSNSTFGDLTDKSYPFAFMLASAGYLLTMLGDCVIMYVTRNVRNRDSTGKVRVAEEGGPDENNPRAKEDVNPMFLQTTSLGDTILLLSEFQVINDAWRNLWTISLHKIFAAISMGIALLKMLPTRPFLMTAAYSFAFAISSPIGVGIGIAIDATTEGHVADWIYAISMGIACGVFIYVAINHLIAKGFKPQNKCAFDTPFYKFLAVLLGVAIIAVVMTWD